MNRTTISALADFPERLEAHYAAIPAEFKRWNPPSWEGIPSEHFNAVGQICHVRDIEIDGYHSRLRRTLTEDKPYLPSIDSEALALDRSYNAANADEALAAFRAARIQTLSLIEGLSPEQLRRSATFEGYGPVTMRGIVHYLCSHDQQHLAGLQWLLGQIEGSRVAGES